MDSLTTEKYKRNYTVQQHTLEHYNIMFTLGNLMWENPAVICMTMLFFLFK